MRGRVWRRVNNEGRVVTGESNVYEAIQQRHQWKKRSRVGKGRNGSVYARWRRKGRRNTVASEGKRSKGRYRGDDVKGSSFEKKPASSLYKQARHRPHYCYKEGRRGVSATCRMCRVEREGGMKPVPSCALPVGVGRRVWTETPIVQKLREGVIERRLRNHPLDCPICDQGGECDLQEQSMEIGSESSRIRRAKRGVEDKERGGQVEIIMTRCIHCTRCVRYAKQVAGVGKRGRTGRGRGTEIGRYTGESRRGSAREGNRVDRCPVGARTAKGKGVQFKGRPWEKEVEQQVNVREGQGEGRGVRHVPGLRNTRQVRPLRHKHEKKGAEKVEWRGDKGRSGTDGRYYGRRTGRRRGGLMESEGVGKKQRAGSQVAREGGRKCNKGATQKERKREKDVGLTRGTKEVGLVGVGQRQKQNPTKALKGRKRSRRRLAYGRSKEQASPYSLSLETMKQVKVGVSVSESLGSEKGETKYLDVVEEEAGYGKAKQARASETKQVQRNAQKRVGAGRVNEKVMGRRGSRVERERRLGTGVDGELGGRRKGMEEGGSRNWDRTSEARVGREVRGVGKRGVARRHGGERVRKKGSKGVGLSKEVRRTKRKAGTGVAKRAKRAKQVVALARGVGVEESKRLPSCSNNSESALREAKGKRQQGRLAEAERVRGVKRGSRTEESGRRQCGRNRESERPALWMKRSSEAAAKPSEGRGRKKERGAISKRRCGRGLSSASQNGEDVSAARSVGLGMGSRQKRVEGKERRSVRRLGGEVLGRGLRRGGGRWGRGDGLGALRAKGKRREGRSLAEGSYAGGCVSKGSYAVSVRQHRTNTQGQRVQGR
jgi:hypothetical protein